MISIASIFTLVTLMIKIFYVLQAYREWVRTSRRGKEEESLPGMNYTPNQLFFLNAAQVRFAHKS
jgi:hypothetical protein